MRYDDDDDDELVEATLDLPVEGYRAWLERGDSMTVCGYQYSDYDNPVARYLCDTIGTCNRLHSDGRQAWFFLALTRSIAQDRHLRMILPEWAGPLVMEYTAYPVRKVSSHPQEKEITRVQARADLDRCLAQMRRYNERKRGKTSKQTAGMKPHGSDAARNREEPAGEAPDADR